MNHDVYVRTSPRDCIPPPCCSLVDVCCVRVVGCRRDLGNRWLLVSAAIGIDRSDPGGHCTGLPCFQFLYTHHGSHVSVSLSRPTTQRCAQLTARSCGRRTRGSRRTRRQPKTADRARMWRGRWWRGLTYAYRQNTDPIKCYLYQFYEDIIDYK